MSWFCFAGNCRFISRSLSKVLADSNAILKKEHKLINDLVFNLKKTTVNTL